MKVLFALFIAATAVAQSPPTCRTVSYPSGGDTVQGFLCRSATGETSPAVVVIHARNGLTDWTKFQAKRLADSGYVALAVDLFRGELPRDSTERTTLVRMTPPGQREQDLLAGVRFLRQQPFVQPDRVGAIGYCMGGSLALRLAITDSMLKAVSLHYPTAFGQLGPATDTAGARKIRAHVLAVFGGKDRAIPLDHVSAFEATMKAAGRPVEVVIYPDASHSFDDSSDPARRIDAADAWRRDLALFRAYLRK